MSEEKATFSFDAPFQTKIAALTIRDAAFVQRTEGLVDPAHFDNECEAQLVNMALKYYEDYGRTPDTVTLVTVMKDEFEKKRIRDDLKPQIKEKLKEILTTDISDRDFAVDKVGKFAQTQALVATFEKGLEHFTKGDYEPIADMFKKALEVGASIDEGEYDYAEKSSQRARVRKDLAEGKIVKRGITTGYLKLDRLLYHQGWGRKEFSLLMGGPKSGKTTAMINFAKNAAGAGHNVLYVTLEVATDIVADRLDALISQFEMKKLKEHPIEINDKVSDFMKRAGMLKLHEFPSGRMAPKDLARLLAKYKARGVVFDLVVVDYADLMRPDRYSDNAIENSKQVYTDLRAIAQEYDLALLTATQSNRDGFKSVVADMDHVSDDFNKVRIADIFITINITADERARNEARLYFAASRNSEQGVTVTVQQDIARMNFIKGIIGIE